MFHVRNVSLCGQLRTNSGSRHPFQEPRHSIFFDASCQNDKPAVFRIPPAVEDANALRGGYQSEKAERASALRSPMGVFHVYVKALIFGPLVETLELVFCACLPLPVVATDIVGHLCLWSDGAE